MGMFRKKSWEESAPDVIVEVSAKLKDALRPSQQARFDAFLPRLEQFTRRGQGRRRGGKDSTALALAAAEAVAELDSSDEGKLARDVTRGWLKSGDLRDVSAFTELKAAGERAWQLAGNGSAEPSEPQILASLKAAKAAGSAALCAAHEIDLVRHAVGFRDMREARENASMQMKLLSIDAAASVSAKEAIDAAELASQETDPDGARAGAAERVLDVMLKMVDL